MDLARFGRQPSRGSEFLFLIQNDIFNLSRHGTGLSVYARGLQVGYEPQAIVPSMSIPGTVPRASQRITFSAYCPCCPLWNGAAPDSLRVVQRGDTEPKI
jgi:hypothetical protein